MLVEELDRFFLHDDESLKPKILETAKDPTKHDSSRSIVNELYKIYEESLIKDSNIAKEVLFIQVLILVRDTVIKHDNMRVFVKRYIKCSVDSAGYDLVLCNLSRQFLSAMVKHEDQAAFIFPYLIDIYVGNVDISGDTPTDKMTQEYEEQQRFIRSNCELLIIDLLLKSTLGLFLNSLKDAMLSESTRARSLDLFASILLKSTVNDVAVVNSSGVFETVLSCLYYDESIVTLNSATTCLCLILPSMVELIPAYLSNLLFIHARLVTLTLEADEDATPSSEKADPLTSSWIKSTNLGDEDDLRLDFSRLFMFLYGLYPLNLVKFLRAPNFYFNKLDQKLVNTLLQNNKYDFFEVKSISANLFANCKAHRNFLLFESAEEELNDRTRWKHIADQNEIANSCLDYAINDALNSLDTSSTSSISNYKADLGHLAETHKQLYTTRKSITSVDSRDESSKSSSDSRINYQPSTSNVEFYKRELLLIRNDLNFIIYLKNLKEAKLRNVLKLYNEESKRHKLAESSILNLRILSNRNAILTKNYDQLKEEYRKFKNDRLNYEELILGKNRNLRKINEENATHLKTQKLITDELTKELSDMKSLLNPKEVEINDLRLSVRMLNDEIIALKRKIEELGEIENIDKISERSKTDEKLLDLTDKLTKLSTN